MFGVGRMILAGLIFFEGRMSLGAEKLLVGREILSVSNF